MCGHSEYPLDAIFQILPGRLSSSLAEKVSLIAAFSPFDIASDLLKRLVGIEISADCIESTAEQKGAEYAIQELEEAEKETETETEMKEGSDSPSRIYFLADDAMLNTRTEGWKENKLGMAFSEENMAKTGSEENQRITIRKKEFVTSFAEGLVPFKKLIRRLAMRVGAYRAKEVVVVSDGAPWIESMFGEMFTNPTHILDWYHVAENIWECSNQIFGKGSQKAAVWVEKYKKMLWNGEVEKFLTDLFAEAMLSENQTPLLKLHTYLKTRTHMIRYDKFRERGLFIGSGAIESANKYVIQNRLKRSGMRWSISGANAIAHLSAAYMSGRWNELWPDRMAV